MTKKPKKSENKYAKVVTRAWKDKRFKEKLFKDPKSAFKEMGIETTEEIQVVEQKPRTQIFFLPAPPAEFEELSDQELEKVAGAGGQTQAQGCSTNQNWCPTQVHTKCGCPSS
jgi:hypothetical protein